MRGKVAGHRLGGSPACRGGVGHIAQAQGLIGCDVGKDERGVFGAARCAIACDGNDTRLCRVGNLHVTAEGATHAEVGHIAVGRGAGEHDGVGASQDRAKAGQSAGGVGRATGHTSRNACKCSRNCGSADSSRCGVGNAAQAQGLTCQHVAEGDRGALCGAARAWGGHDHRAHAHSA